MQDLSLHVIPPTGVSQRVTPNFKVMPLSDMTNIR